MNGSSWSWFTMSDGLLGGVRRFVEEVKKTAHPDYYECRHCSELVFVEDWDWTAAGYASLAICPECDQTDSETPWLPLSHVG